MKKRILLIMLSTLLTMSTVVSSYAFSPGPTALNVNLESISSELLNIPIYLTSIDDIDNDALKESAQETISENLQLSAEKTYNKYTVRDEGVLKNETTGGFELRELTLTEKEELVENPLFTNTLIRVQQLLDEGTGVNYINYFVTENVDAPDEILRAGSNANDPSYWESACKTLGTYDGYKFLYLESSVGVESSWVTPKDISTTITWPTLITKSIKTAIGLTKNNVASTIINATDALTSIFGSVKTPYKVAYSTSGGYLKTKVSGEIYIRDVLIRDKLNRISGYAYYNWGSTEQTKMRTKFDAKWPISKRTNSTYNYDTKVLTSGLHTTSTPGFAGNTTLYKNILALYKNTSGYFKYNEQLNINKLVANLIN